MAPVEKSALLKPRIGEVAVEIEGVGDVHVRPLTRGESLIIRAIEDEAERDNMIISLGMVEPKLTPEEVAEWAENAPAGETVRVGLKIASLSGMLEGQPKEVTKSTSRRRR